MTPSKETLEHETRTERNSPTKKIITKDGRVIFPTKLDEIVALQKIIDERQGDSNLSFFNNRWYELTFDNTDAGIGEIVHVTDVTKYMANKIGLPDSKATTDLMVSYLQNLRMHPQGFSLIMIDVDHFKVINDTYGHLVGDDVLRVIAKAVKASVRSTDIVGRYGGDEIFLLLPNILLENIIMKINMIMGKAQNPETFLLDIPSLQSPPTLSIGAVQITASEVVDLMASVAAFEPTERYSALLKTLIDKADRAMYQSKGNGRNRATIVDISGNVISVLEPEQLQTLSYKRRTTDAV